MFLTYHQRKEKLLWLSSNKKDSLPKNKGRTLVVQISLPGDMFSFGGNEAKTLVFGAGVGNIIQE